MSVFVLRVGWGQMVFYNDFNKEYLSGPLFTEQMDVLFRDLVNYRSPGVKVETHSIALKFDRHGGSIAVVKPVKFQSNTNNITHNHAASIFHEILRHTA